MVADTIPMSLLSLHTLPIETLPTTSSEDYAAFTETLQAEAASLWASTSWSQPQSWHHDLLHTRSLPPSACSSTKSRWHTPPPEAAPLGHDKQRSWSSRFTGGGGVKDKEQNFAGVAWHMRESIMREDQTGYGYQVFWDTLAVRHCEQEAEYVSTLSKVHAIGDNNCWLKQYDLPFPTTNRSFLSHVLVLPLPHTEHGFQIFSLPVAANESAPLDKGFVRGLYVAVEEVEEVETDDGHKAVRWRCASMSSPGGSIPTRLAESHMDSSLASNVPAYFHWLETKYGGHGAHVAHNGFLSMPKLVKRLSLKRLASRGTHERKPSGDGVAVA